MLSVPENYSQATYVVDLMLIGKRIVDFLLVIIKLFFSRYYGRGATSENRSKICIFKWGWVSLAQNFSRTRGRPPPTILRVAKLHASTFHTI